MARPFWSRSIVLLKKKKEAEVRLKTAAADKCECFSRGRAALWEVRPFVLAIDSSTNTPHVEWKSMLSGDGGPSPYQTHLQARTHFQLQLQQPRYFSPAKRLWKVWRLILLLPQKSNKCWNVTFCSHGNESFVVVFLFDSKHKQSSIAAYLHCFSPAPHKFCWAPTVYSHFDSATICQSHETHNCSPIHSVNTLFKKSSLWGDQLNHKES